MDNNFKELEKQTIQNRLRSQEETKKKINANIHFFGFISSILDVYLPKIGSVIISFQTPDNYTRSDKSSYPNQK